MNKFNPEMLMLARESRGLTQADLAKELGVTQGAISKIESGMTEIPYGVAEAVAAKLDYEPDLFYQTDRVYGFNATVFFHRKRQSLPERILRKLHAYMNITRIRIARLLRATGLQTQVPFPQIELEDYRNDPEQIAKILRAAWLLPPGPVVSVTRAIEDAGGIVIRTPFGSSKIDAISEWVPGYPPVFLINSDAEITGDRMRLTLAHEIAHMVMHRLPNPLMEEQANLFAAEFLMPRKEIKGYLYGVTLPKLALLKRVWKVSMAALVQRAFQLGTITDKQRRNLYINLARRGYKLREPIETDVPIEFPTLLASITKAHIEQLGYSLDQLRRFLFYVDDAELRSVYLGRPILQAV